jgi:hypothetical protein
MSLLDFDGDEDWDRELAEAQRDIFLLRCAGFLLLTFLGTLAGVGVAYLTGLIP